MEWAYGENPIGFWSVVLNVITFCLAMIIALGAVALICWIVYLIGAWVYSTIDDWIWEQGKAERQKYWEAQNAWIRLTNEESNQLKADETNDK